VGYARRAKIVREFLLDLERRMLIAAGDQGLSADVQNLGRIGLARKRADALDPLLSLYELFGNSHVPRI
jgi:hypothetical protein